MVVMAAKWTGKCKVCGRVILPGTQMDWEKGGGARHLTAADCAAAPLQVPPNGPLRGPQVESPEDRARVERLLLSHPWKAATSKRYEKLPHQYTLRKQWADDEAFLWVASHIRATGYEKYFLGRVWIYYDVGEHQYWDCGGPVADCGLINRVLPASVHELAGRS